MSKYGSGMGEINEYTVASIIVSHLLEVTKNVWLRESYLFLVIVRGASIAAKSRSGASEDE